MAPPAEMVCSYPDCEFSTPSNIPTYELVLKSLELHIQTAHRIPSQSNNVVPKVEKPKRPSITMNMSESDWTFFTHRWERYKRQSQIKESQIADELWACLDSDLERLAFQDGLESVMSVELLPAIKKLAVTSLHPSVHVVALHQLRQDSSESTKAYSARVKGLAKKDRKSVV